MKVFDVIIIGGGLSGSSTALNLSKKGYSVLVIEKEKFQDYKSCAGGMASSMQKFLPLDIKDSIESKIKNVEFRWKASDNVTDDLTGESPFWIIKREKLDQLLLDESLSNGAHIMRPLLIEKIIKKNDKWEITCNNKLKYPAHLDWDPSAITRNSDVYFILSLHVISHLSFFFMIFFINNGFII